MFDVAMDLSAREVQTSLLFSGASLQVKTLLCGCQLRTIRRMPWRASPTTGVACLHCGGWLRRVSLLLLAHLVLRDSVVPHFQMIAMMQHEWHGIAFFDEVDIAPSQFIDATGVFLDSTAVLRRRHRLWWLFLSQFPPEWAMLSTWRPRNGEAPESMRCPAGTEHDQDVRFSCCTSSHVRSCRGYFSSASGLILCSHLWRSVGRSRSPFAFACLFLFADVSQAQAVVVAFAVVVRGTLGGSARLPVGRYLHISVPAPRA